MTTEQRMRGADARVGWVLFLTAYNQDALASLMQTFLCNALLEEHGAGGVLDATYRMEYSLTDRELNA